MRRVTAPLMKLLRPVARYIPGGNKGLLVVTTAVFLLIILALAIIAVRRRVKRRRHDDHIYSETSGPRLSAPETPAIEGRRRGWWWLLIALAITAALLYANNYSDNPSFCGNCHTVRPYYRAWKHSRHARVSCNVCHTRPGASGYLISKAEGLRNLSLTTSYYARFRPVKSSPVDNVVCLRCHSEAISRTIVSRGVKMSHKELVTYKMPCSYCHQGISHQVSKRAPISMEKCVFCHNGTTAPAACKACHLKDVGAGRSTLDDYPNVELSGELCGGCHPKPDCGRCHTIGLGGTIGPPESND